MGPMKSAVGWMGSWVEEDPADPAEWTFHRWRRVLRVRYVGIALVAVAGGALFDWWLGPAILFGVGGYNLVHDVYLRQVPRPPVWLPATDVFLGAAVITLEPQVFLPGTLIMLTAVALATATGTPTTVRSVSPAVAAVVVGCVALITLDVTGRVEDGASAAAGFAVGGVMVIIGLGSLVDSEARLRLRLLGLVDQIDAVVWTRDPETHRFTYVSSHAAGLLGYSPAGVAGAGVLAGSPAP